MIINYALTNLFLIGEIGRTLYEFLSYNEISISYIEQAERTEAIKNKRVRFEYIVLLNKLGNINLF